MDNQEYVLYLFQDGHLCDCKHEPIWDRLEDDNGRFAGYELAHKSTCIGRVKAAEILKELQSVEV